MRYAVVTDKGRKREGNEDSFFATESKLGVLSNLFLVADGMGGHKAGEYASALSVSSIKAYLEKSDDATAKQALSNGIKAANADILSHSQTEPEKAGMGTTLVLCTIGDNILVANIGDSRLYIYKDRKLSQITKDHTVVSEMVRMGSISKEVAKRHPKRHMLTRALGVEEPVEVDFFEVPINDAEQILLCSDGLYNMVSDGGIADILSSADDTETKAKRLLETANENGGDDNITVLLIDLIN